METPFNFLHCNNANVSSPISLCFSTSSDFSKLQSADELKSTLFCTRMELEMTKLAAEEELKRRDDQLTLLTHLLNRAIKDRDDALAASHGLLRRRRRRRSPAPLSGVSDALSPSDCEDSIVSSSPAEEATLQLVPGRPLPEKGKLLQAVVRAGPLLQTLMLAGPLPQWRHPPPPLEVDEIPPVGMGGRGEECSPRPYKIQRIGS